MIEKIKKQNKNKVANYIFWGTVFIKTGMALDSRRAWFPVDYGLSAGYLYLRAS